MISNFFDSFERFFLSIYDALLQSLVALIDLIPVPDFVQNVNITVPPMAAYFMDLFHVQYGATVLVSAHIFRFILRRLPIVGG